MNVVILIMLRDCTSNSALVVSFTFLLTVPVNLLLYIYIIG